MAKCIFELSMNIKFTILKEHITGRSDEQGRIILLAFNPIIEKAICLTGHHVFEKILQIIFCFKYFCAIYCVVVHTK